MRVFLTGATGFIGTALIPELVGAGHTVVGLTRSDAGAASLDQAGVEVHRGDIYDLDSIKAGAERADAVIHLAFNHDFSKFAENCETDRRLIETLGEVLAGSGRPLIVTSGTGLIQGANGAAATENDAPVSSEVFPRAASEEATLTIAERGCRAMVVRLPQVHDTKKQGLVSYIIPGFREKGVVAYIGEGKNRWPAGAVSDVARLYRLVLEKGKPGGRYHAVGEEGVSTKAICEVLGAGLKLPVVSITPEEAPAHFGWMAHLASADLPASSAITREELGWEPAGPSILTDLKNMDYAR
ncbi:SDR family oxidoreductase [Silvibacterium acidisoli]|uniref:SDR family oxidoreductase n=1 Tax=Acidobacteriaceae bacterium ZG23-2 TaxID=2883246 RepID=UPI00406D0F68